MKRVFVLLILSVLIYCTHEKPLPSGYEMLDRQNKGEVIVKDYPAVASAYYWSAPKAGSRGTLMLGAYEQFKSRIALRFINIGNVVDTASVQEAVLNLSYFHHTGPSDSFTVNIYPITSAWLDDYTSEAEWDNAVWTDLENKYDTGSLIGSFTAFAADSDTVMSIPLDPAAINQWITDGSNNGIMLDFDDANVMCHYYSTEAAGNWPNLGVIYETTAGDGTLDTVTVYGYNDASLISQDITIPENELQHDPDMLYVGNASGMKSILQFHVNDIPDNATIHHAMLTMYVKTDMTDSTSAVRIGMVPIVGDSTWSPTEMVYDSVYTKPAGYATPDINPFEMDTPSAVTALSHYIQLWAWDILPNYGVVMRSFEEGYDLSEVEFYSGKNDSTQTPVLRVTYSLPPDSRFSE